MKSRFIPGLLVIIALMTTLTMMEELLGSKAEAQGGLRVRLPFAGTYRLTSYVDHNAPDYDEDGSIVLFNGETYSNCPAANEAWTNQGPYCYHSHSGIDWAMKESTSVLAVA
jgi:hypothetical protein